MFSQVIAAVKDLLGIRPAEDLGANWNPQWSIFLAKKVLFYRALGDADKRLFERRILLFLDTTSIESGHVEVTDEDRLLVAASAIIPVWQFPSWHYFNLNTVFLMQAAFNEEFEFGQPDSRITGMVGTGMMSGKMLLSKPALHLGFDNARDKQNVGIHEFVHLIDMADGECDGYPERLREHAYSVPWFELVFRKTEEICARKSNIRDYGATNRMEFFAVASEYFFERPKMLRKRHPQLYQQLADFYRTDIAAIELDLGVRKKDPCPCGSGRRYKRCCMPAA